LSMWNHSAIQANIIQAWWWQSWWYVLQQPRFLMTVIPVVCITHFLSTPNLQITLSCSQKHSIETHVMINRKVLSVWKC
jgi:hypothetical protein